MKKFSSINANAIKSTTKLTILVVLFYSILSICFLFTASAQYQKYRFSRLDITKGLPINDVNCFFRDSKGFLWVGTLSGLARFDGNNFKTFRHDANVLNSINDDDVRRISEGPGGKLWIETRAGTNIYDPATDYFGHDLQSELRNYNIAEANVRLMKKSKAGIFMFASANSLYAYDPKLKKTRQFVHRLNDPTSITHSPIVDLAEGKNGDFWLIHVDGTLEMFNYRKSAVMQRLPLSGRFLNSESDSYRIFIDKQGLLWIYNMSVAAGVYCYNPAAQKWLKFSKGSRNYRLSSDMISGIIQDEKDNIWIATDHGGINIIDKSDLKVSYLISKPNDDKSLSQNSISSIYYDKLGVVWIGTFRKGINLYYPGIFKFGLIENSTITDALIHDDVNELTEGKDGNIWIGTNGRGLRYYNRKTNESTYFRNDPFNLNSLSHDAVVSVYLDRSKKLWVGTYSGGLDYFENGKFKHFVYDPNNPKSLSDNRISDIMEDSKGRFWVGTGGGGLNLLDRKTGTFKRYTTRKELISSDFVFKIVEDRNHNVWAGTSFGMNLLLENEDKFLRIVNDPNDGNSLINDNINSFIEDKKGYLWICTRNGLSVYNPQTKTFQNFRKSDGLPDNNLKDIQQDNQGCFWLSSSNGLSRISVTYGKKLKLLFENFDENDGLQGREFNRGASVKLGTGELAFAGPDGINIFYPQLIKTNVFPPKLFITDFQLFGKSLSAESNRNGEGILEKSIIETKELVLNHNQNVFVIEFAALNFKGPNKVKYMYMLDGFDKTWILAENNIRKASYTNLPPGKYKFKVKSQDSGINQNSPYVTLDIEIRYPWYATTFAYAFYVLMLCLILYYIRSRGIKRLQNKFFIEQQKLKSERLLENERLEATRNRELDALKIKFLTNLSHEFRTPLSLILAPVETILESDYDSKIKEQVSFIHKNARRLLNLVNQLLDFREMEMKELKLQKREGEIVAFIRDITYSFKDIGDKKNIQLSFNTNYDSLTASFDHEKIERVLFNLLSNSFKFTPAGGKVSVWLTKVTDDHPMLEIKVMDTGIGIAKDKQDKIFERFFQNDVNESIINQGSGIGLSIVKEFVQIHGGRIIVEGDEGSGSCFTVTLPFDELKRKTDETNKASNELITAGKITDQQRPPQQISSRKLSVLIVEDDEDLRYYLRENLKGDFEIIEAKDGKEGWQKALFYQPDFLVSDISMPEMNGILLCRKIKSDSRTSQIPVLLLTALSGEKQELMGLETGASDYMTKPFSFEVLRSKIKNILKQQETTRKRYSKQVEVKPPTVEMEDPDEKFLQEVLLEIESNIDNSNFSVDMLSKLVLVSRGTLYSRILTLTGKTPLDFIKSYRLKRAAQLLEHGKFTVSVICYKTGFKTTKNFVKSFKKEFDLTPSQYAESKNTP
ncbi:MAG: two-component regulator propeller domain-containing protein [Pelobium sp.]